MASGIFFQFHASHHAGVNLLGLGTILVLRLARVPKLFFQTVLVIWHKWAQISTANAAAQGIYTTLGRLPASIV